MNSSFKKIKQDTIFIAIIRSILSNEITTHVFLSVFMTTTSKQKKYNFFLKRIISQNWQETNDVTLRWSYWYRGHVQIEKNGNKNVYMYHGGLFKCIMLQFFERKEIEKGCKRIRSLNWHENNGMTSQTFLLESPYAITTFNVFINVIMNITWTWIVVIMYSLNYNAKSIYLNMCHSTFAFGQISLVICFQNDPTYTRKFTPIGRLVAWYKRWLWKQIIFWKGLIIWSCQSKVNLQMHPEM